MQELVESSKELVELSNDVSLVKVIDTTSDEPLLPNSVGVGNHEYSSILQKEVLPSSSTVVSAVSTTVVKKKVLMSYLDLWICQVMFVVVFPLYYN